MSASNTTFALSFPSLNNKNKKRHL